MKKKIILIISLISILGIGIIIFLYSKEERKTIWNPPINGLFWGMSIDAVEEVLDYQAYELFEQNKVSNLSISEKYNTIYGIEMALILTFDHDMGLIKFEGTCEESDLPKLKEILLEKYKGYDSGQQLGDGIRWASERVIERKNYEELMKRLSDKFGNLSVYDSLKQGFEASPLVYVELIETGDRRGTFIVNGHTQVEVDSLEKYIKPSN